MPWAFYRMIYLEDYKTALQNLKQNTVLRTGQYINFANDPFLNPLRKHQEYVDIETAVFKDIVVPQIEFTPKKTSNSYPFEKEELQEFVQQLETEMKTDKPFLNPELSLKKLAADISLHPNKLSWLLNNHFGKNFNDYVNKHRIKEFQQLAVAPENKNITLLGLAYDSGFNSKTVFNTFFKKETGMTPKQWVKGNS